MGTVPAGQVRPGRAGTGGSAGPAPAPWYLMLSWRWPRRGSCCCLGACERPERRGQRRICTRARGCAVFPHREPELDPVAAGGDRGQELAPIAGHCATPVSPLDQRGGTHLLAQAVARGHLRWLGGAGQPGLVTRVLGLAVGVGARLAVRVLVVAVGTTVTGQVARGCCTWRVQQLQTVLPCQICLRVGMTQTWDPRSRDGCLAWLQPQ